MKNEIILNNETKELEIDDISDLEIKLDSFSSLDLIASKYLESDGKYKVLIKAKKNYSYLKTYTVKGTIKVDQEDTFLSDEELSKYDDYQPIVVDDNTFTNGEKMALNILKYKMYKEENKYDYVPNYLRSELS